MKTRIFFDHNAEPAYEIELEGLMGIGQEICLEREDKSFDVYKTESSRVVLHTDQSLTQDIRIQLSYKDAHILIDHNTIRIRGPIKSLKDYQTVKERVEIIVDRYEEIVFDIQESHTLTSSIIGYFLYLVNSMQKRIHIICHHKDLFDNTKALSVEGILTVSCPYHEN